MILRGSVVLVDFQGYDPGVDLRPALIVQNDRDKTRMQKTIVLQITGNTTRADEDTQYLIGPTHPDWTQSGLRFPSVVNCSNINTITKDAVVRTLGSLPSIAMQQIEEGMKIALEMP